MKLQTKDGVLITKTPTQAAYGPEITSRMHAAFDMYEQLSKER